jgi:hypothetical protein
MTTASYRYVGGRPSTASISRRLPAAAAAAAATAATAAAAAAAAAAATSATATAAIQNVRHGFRQWRGRSRNGKCSQRKYARQHGCKGSRVGYGPHRGYRDTRVRPRCVWRWRKHGNADERRPAKHSHAGICFLLPSLLASLSNGVQRPLRIWHLLTYRVACCGGRA